MSSSPFRATPKKTYSMMQREQSVLSRLAHVFKRMRSRKMLDPARSGVMGYVCNAAKCAFGAYRSPRVAGVEEYTTQQNTITHLSWDLFNYSMVGALKIRLKSCENLRNADWAAIGGKSDPYVVFTTGSSMVKSSTCYNSLNPVWDCDEFHYLFVRDRHLDAESGRYLTIEVFDKDTIARESKFDHVRRKDPCLGTGQLDMFHLMKPGEHSMNVKLSHGLKGRRPPSVEFTVEFIPVETALKEMNKDFTSDCWDDGTEHLEHEIRWPELSHMTETGSIEVQPVAYIDAVTTGTQAWIHVNREANLVVVAFRGTEINSLKDLCTDLKCIPGRLTGPMLSARYQMKPTEILSDKRIRLHSGFRDAYESIRESVLRIVYDITGWDDNWTVCVTGHSLGGALATICAFEIKNRELPARELSRGASLRSMLQPRKIHDQETDVKKPKVSMLSFGAPKVGTAAFARLYDQTIPSSFRVINGDDPITRVPPLYTHTGGEIVVQSSGGLDVDGKTLQSARPTIRSRDQPVVRSRGIGVDAPQVNAVVLESSDDSSDCGIRVVSHLQPRYFENIKAAVSQFFKEDMEERGRPIRILRATRVLSKHIGVVN